MPQDDYTPQPDDPIEGNPILLRPRTFARHAKVVDYVERANRARYPHDGRGRTTKPSAGAWGYLASGNTISAASGLSLGSGQVTLCSRSGSSLTADGDVITAYNSGGTITGPQTLDLSWTDGDWAVCQCGGGCNCDLCTLPESDGTVMYLQGPLYGPYDLIYQGGCVWTTNCIHDAWTVAGGEKFSMFCSGVGKTIVFADLAYTGGPGTDCIGDPQAESTQNGSLFLDHYTCSPLFFKVGFVGAPIEFNYIQFTFP